MKANTAGRAGRRMGTSFITLRAKMDISACMHSGLTYPRNTGGTHCDLPCSREATIPETEKLSVARDKLVFDIVDARANIWLAELPPD